MSNWLGVSTWTERQLELLQAQLGDWARTLRLAQVQTTSPDPKVAADGRAAVTYARTQYRAVLVRLAALRADANANDAPSDFLLKLDTFSDGAIKIAHDLGVAVPKLAGGVGDVLANLDWIIWGLVALAGLYLYWTLKGKGR